jgi:hypothetical protein
VLVTPAVRGYDIVALEEPNFQLLNNRESLDWAVRLAHWYAVARDGRVWVSRDGQTVEPLVFERVGLEPDTSWFAYRADLVRQHVPQSPGIYVLRAGGPVFIAETQNLEDGLHHHLEQPLPCPEAAAHLEVAFSVLASAPLRRQKTAELIRWWRPPCNQSE